MHACRSELIREGDAVELLVLGRDEEFVQFKVGSSCSFHAFIIRGHYQRALLVHDQHALLMALIICSQLNHWQHAHAASAHHTMP